MRPARLVVDHRRGAGRHGPYRHPGSATSTRACYLMSSPWPRGWATVFPSALAWPADRQRSCFRPAITVPPSAATRLPVGSVARYSTSWHATVSRSAPPRWGGVCWRGSGKRWADTPASSPSGGWGLMVGIELDRCCTELVGRALEEQRLLISVTRERTIRLLPPLVCEEAQIEDIVARLALLLNAGARPADRIHQEPAGRRPGPTAIHQPPMGATCTNRR